MNDTQSADEEENNDRPTRWSRPAAGGNTTNTIASLSRNRIYGNLRAAAANNQANQWEVQSASNSTSYQDRIQLNPQPHQQQLDVRSDYLRTIESTFHQRSAAHLPRRRNLLLNSGIQGGAINTLCSSSDSMETKVLQMRERMPAEWFQEIDLLLQEIQECKNIENLIIIKIILSLISKILSMLAFKQVR